MLLIWLEIIFIKLLTVKFSQIRTSSVFEPYRDIFSINNFFFSLATRFHVNTQQRSSSAITMADRRPDEQEMSRPKKPRTGDLEPASNPYLAHMYEETNDYSNGYGSRNGYGNGSSINTSLTKFKRHQTTALQAHTAEDGPNNPFNNAPLSKQYFNILKSRRDLPVHKQR